MKNKELYNIMNEVSKGDFYNLTGVDFVLALARNIKKIEQELEILDNLRKPTDKYKEYMKKVSELRAKFADKTTEGKPVIRRQENGIEVYVISEKLEEYNKEYESLQQESDNAKLIEEQKRKDTLFEAAVEKNCDIKFHKIGKKDIPAEVTFKQMYIIEFMIN